MEKQQKYRDNYLYNQLISYIGNKRKLVPMIESVLKQCFPSSKGKRFMDPFAGSGVVSRLANTMGFRVWANDWEPYGQAINLCYLGNTPQDAESLFRSMGSLPEIVEHLNHLPNPKKEDEYIARYYSTQQDDPWNARIGQERLFYTRQNGLILDRIRNEIDVILPPDPGNEENRQARSLLLGPLLYQASKHTNTSGVFKAYHKGFGGYGRDALSRILHPISLEVPCLWNGSYKNQVSAIDANQLAGQSPTMDVAYLDPPYNQHQYGSNYHLLNSLVLWDKIPQPLDRNEKGELRRKAGIREDWIKTRSPYCRKDRATQVFKNLLNDLDARYVLISYSTDGIIPLEEMRALCEESGKVDLFSNDYAVYRGGRQSNSRKQRNREFLWMIDKSAKSTRSSAKRLDCLLIIQEIQLLYQNQFRKKEMSLSPGPVNFEDFQWKTVFKLESIKGLEGFSKTKLLSLKKYLEHYICETHEEALDYCLSYYVQEANSREQRTLALEILRLLKKLAHPKTKDIFINYFQRVFDWVEQHGLGSSLSEKLEELKRVAELRLKLEDLEKELLI